MFFTLYRVLCPTAHSAFPYVLKSLHLSVYPPPCCGGRTDSPGGEGDGGSIFWKTREIGLPSYNDLSTYETMEVYCIIDSRRTYLITILLEWSQMKWPWCGTVNILRDDDAQLCKEGTFKSVSFKISWIGNFCKIVCIMVDCLLKRTVIIFNFHYRKKCVPL